MLILGTMPGPEALRRRQYYGFPGNHFWPVIQILFGDDRGGTIHAAEEMPRRRRDAARLLSYPEKLRLLKTNQIALWDVIASCQRTGASDSAITRVTPNRIPELLKRYPNIRVIFVNGKTAERLFRLYFGKEIKRPVRYLPSTSPAHAAMSFQEKLKRWRVVRERSGQLFPGEADAEGAEQERGRPGGQERRKQTPFAERE